MPKAKARKKAARVATASVRNTAVTSPQTVERSSAVPPTRARQRDATRTPGMQSVIMPGMVALGCLGMAFTFTVFSTDPNRLLFAGLAAIMAIMWAVSFGVRLRKIIQRR